MILNQSVSACYCSKGSFEPNQYFGSTYVFEGIVTKVEECRTYFKIIKNYKGNLTDEDAYTDTTCDPYCGMMVTFKVGQVWIMWGKGNEHYTFYTDDCTRSSIKNKSNGHELEQIQRLSSEEGYSKFYSTDSILIAEGSVKNQQREGQWKFYDEYGFPKEIVTYKNNRVTKKRIKFYIPPPIEYGNDIEHEKIRNGNIPEYIGKVMSIMLYDNDYKLKSEKDYNKEGSLVAQRQYKNGKPDGHHFAKHYSKHYKKGKQEGKYWIKHYKSEIIKTEGNYKNGKPIGEFKYFSEKGELIYKSYNEHLEYMDVHERIRNKR